MWQGSETLASLWWALFLLPRAGSNPAFLLIHEGGSEFESMPWSGGEVAIRSPLSVFLCKSVCSWVFTFHYKSGKCFNSLQNWMLSTHCLWEEFNHSSSPMGSTVQFSQILFHPHGTARTIPQPTEGYGPTGQMLKQRPAKWHDRGRSSVLVPACTVTLSPFHSTLGEAEEARGSGTKVKQMSKTSAIKI